MSSYINLLSAAKVVVPTTNCEGSLGMDSVDPKLCPEIPLTPSAPGNEFTIVACGCFWSPQPALQAVPGVKRCIVGYCGGLQPDPTYQEILDYTEALLVEYDPTVVRFEDILKKWRSFGQPQPASTQYKWAVFTLNEEQERVAKEFCADEKHIAIEPVTQFYMAEDFHQNFLKKTGNLR